MFTGKLYPYQERAVADILRLQRILVAYSMGTGKTVLTIAALEELLGTRTINNALLIVPASLKWQWAQSISKFTDVASRTLALRGAELTVPIEETCMVLDGSASARARQWEYIGLVHPEYVIMSYAGLRTDWEQLLEHPFDAVVLDEATAIKSFAAQVTKKAKRLQPQWRIALAGLPVENRPEDIFSIMEWVDRGILGRWDLFDKSYIARNAWGAVTGYKNLRLLNSRLRAAMIRKSRLDPEVARYLPAVAETTRAIALDAATRRFYKIILQDLGDALEEAAEAGSPVDLAAYYAGEMGEEDKRAQGKVMARLLAARLLLCHPGLLMDSAEAFHEGRGAGSQYIADLVAASWEYPNIVATPKLDELERLVAQMLAEPGVKVAVFTSYRRLLPYLSDRLDRFGPHVQFHGEMDSTAKAAAKARFASDPEVRVFLATNAGGYGLDLPEAQYLINYDLPDGNGVLQQRNTRHVRASSTHSHVYVVNLIIEDSVEERQQATLALRGRLSGAIVDGRGDSTFAADVETLTKHLDRNS
jgi:SNF2 family DNA or RNA helicase